MCLGKSKCKILKEIRQKIADENDIPYITSECTHKGDCLGTCPKCEQELQYLEKQLERRRKLGKTVVVSALALSVATVTSGCNMLGDFMSKRLSETRPTGAIQAITGDDDSSVSEAENDKKYGLFDSFTNKETNSCDDDSLDDNCSSDVVDKAL